MNENKNVAVELRLTLKNYHHFHTFCLNENVINEFKDP
jgi:hypothetical protein